MVARLQYERACAEVQQHRHTATERISEPEAPTEQRIKEAIESILKALADRNAFRFISVRDTVFSPGTQGVCLYRIMGNLGCCACICGRDGGLRWMRLSSLALFFRFDDGVQ